MHESFTRFAGWTAYANAALYLAIFVTITIFFIAGGWWGTLNDAISVFWGLSFMPLLLFFYRLNRPDNATLSVAALLVGAAAMLSFSFLQTLLVARVVAFEQTFAAVTTLGGVLGVSLLVSGLLAHAGQALPAGLARLLIIFAVAYLVASAGFLLGGWQNPLSWIGYAASAVTGPIWAIWLGRVLLHGALPTTALAAS